MKKRTLLVMVMAFFSFLSHAQFIEKGKHILGGSISLGFSSTNDSTQAGGSESKARNFSANLSPSYGKAIKSDLVFGYYANLGVGLYHLEQSRFFSKNKTNDYHFGGGLFLEKFFSLSNRLAISGHLSGGINYSNFTGKIYVHNAWTQTNTTKNISAGISLAPTLNFKLTQKLLVGLSANDFISIGYVKGTVKSSGANTTSVESEHSNFFAGTMFNYGKSLKDITFSFRFLL